jgi:GT2 family glycosyltransferase
MSQLSVIIVNYNVKFFLEQCLHSVQSALKGLDGEIFVVDNNSVDGSMAMVRQKFPDVIRIENKDNRGFSKANNQAIEQATGQYILLLNPDTVVEEDTFSKVIAFMGNHPNAGALGVKMIDGKGHFLPESKRALPTPWVSFYKVFGLSWLFPKSRRFGQYHLGYLDKEEINKVDVLPGAFMLLRKEALDKSGLLDETFFMYGEDIDLSYRISKAGFDIYYYPETAIIHYKGESTKKSSVNYVLVFYQAMIIFAKKHFSQKNARLFSFSIHCAIYFRMAIALTRRFFEKAFYPLMDALIGVAGLLLSNRLLENLKFGVEGSHPPEFLRFFVPAYILVWLLSVFFAGGYDRPYSLKRLFQGILSGTVIILALYSLLPEAYRFSRTLIPLGTTWNILFFFGLRGLINQLGINSLAVRGKTTKRLVIVGKKTEFDRISSLLKEIGESFLVVGRVEPDENPDSSGANTLGSISSLAAIVEINKIDEIIFSGKDLGTGEIIRNMLALKKSQTDYKISPPNSTSIIGSNSINTAGELYVIDINSIAKPSNRRNKRIFDFVLSLLLLLTLPLNFWFFIRRAGKYLSSIFLVLLGFKTWVGYFPGVVDESQPLPKLKTAVVPAYEHRGDFDNERKQELNILYARNYSIVTDLRILRGYVRGFF